MIKNFKDLIQREDYLFYVKYARVPFTGLVEDFHDNGQLSHRQNFKDGKKHGPEEKYDPDGLPIKKSGDLIQRKDHLFYVKYARVPFTGISEYFYWNWGLSEDERFVEQRNNYKDGKLHGLSEGFFSEDQLSSRQNYKDGQLHGLSEIYWYPNYANLWIKENYKDGKLHGLYEEYYENGRLKERKNYKDGEYHGPWEEYHKNGRIKWKQIFKNGIPLGLGERYYKNGNLECKSYIYKNDGTMKDYTGNSKYYYENGQLLQKKNYKDGKRHGLWEYYYRHGQLKWQHKYKQGKKYGLDEGYYGNGQVKWRQKYKNGEPNGPREEYHRNGKLKKVSKHTVSKLKHF